MTTPAAGALTEEQEDAIARAFASDESFVVGDDEAASVQLLTALTVDPLGQTHAEFYEPGVLESAARIRQRAAPHIAARYLAETGASANAFAEEWSAMRRTGATTIGPEHERVALWLLRHFDTEPGTDTPIQPNSLVAAIGPLVITELFAIANEQNRAEIARLNAEAEQQHRPEPWPAGQFLRPTDRMAGLFYPLPRDKGQIPAPPPVVFSPSGVGTVTYIALRETKKYKRREINLRLPLSAEDVVDSYMAAEEDGTYQEKRQLRQDLLARYNSGEEEQARILSHMQRQTMSAIYDHLGPRGLAFYRTAFQREYAVAKHSGLLDVDSEGAVLFTINATRVLDTLVKKQADGRREHRQSHHEELAGFVGFLGGKTGLEVRTEAFVSDGTNENIKVETFGPPLSIVRTTTATKKVKGHGEQTITLGWRVYVPPAARALLELPTQHHTWQDEAWMALDRINRHPYAAQITDYLDEQIAIGWHRYGGTVTVRFDTLFAECNLLAGFKAKEVRERRRWLKSSLLPQLAELGRDKIERGLFTALTLEGVDVRTLDALPPGDPMDWTLVAKAGPVHGVVQRSNPPLPVEERRRLSAAKKRQQRGSGGSGKHKRTAKTSKSRNADKGSHT